MPDPKAAKRELAPSISIKVNDVAMNVAMGTTVAAAVLIAGFSTRTSVSGEPRSPLCGMGTCFECRVWIDGQPHQRSCQALCEDGMDVRTS